MDKDARIRELEAALAEAQRELEALKALDSSKSPCGHFATHAVTTDGGKTIRCLECDLAARDRALERILAVTVSGNTTWNELHDAWAECRSIAALALDAARSRAAEEPRVVYDEAATVTNEQWDMLSQRARVGDRPVCHCGKYPHPHTHAEEEKE